MFGLTPRSTANGRASRHTTHSNHHAAGRVTTTTTTTAKPRRGLFGRSRKERVAGGYKAALANPNTTSDGRKHAKHELHKMGKSAHVPFMTKVKRTLGIRSTPRRARTVRTTRV